MYRYLMIYTIMLVVLTSLIIIPDADPHVDWTKITNVTEACWLIGSYSEGRTFCQYNKYTHFQAEETNNHHVALRNEKKNLTIIVHIKGHDNHGVDVEGPYRKYRVRTVLSDCGECN